MSLLSAEDMLARVLELNDGNVSKEFEEEDIPAVRTAIKSLFGKTNKKQFIMTTEVTFGGEQFIYQNEWNDPCLISGSTRGDEHLRCIHEELNKG